MQEHDAPVCTNIYYGRSISTSSKPKTTSMLHATPRFGKEYVNMRRNIKILRRITNTNEIVSTKRVWRVVDKYDHRPSIDHATPNFGKIPKIIIIIKLYLFFWSLGRDKNHLVLDQRVNHGLIWFIRFRSINSYSPHSMTIEIKICYLVST